MTKVVKMIQNYPSVEDVNRVLEKMDETRDVAWETIEKNTTGKNFGGVWKFGCFKVKFILFE